MLFTLMVTDETTHFCTCGAYDFNAVAAEEIETDVAVIETLSGELAAAFADTAAMQTEMEELLALVSEESFDQVKVLEVSLTANGSTASANNFPADGVDVFVSYEALGVNEEDNFVIGHMFAETYGGHKAGEMEFLDYTSAEENGVKGVCFHVSSLFPIMTAKVAEDPVNPPIYVPDDGVQNPGKKSAAAFIDVASNAYYYDAVLWAAEKDITKGIDDTHFAPENSVTRAETVTFLWRAAGCPEPKGDAGKFIDVPANKYYTKAVAWAVEQGITLGTSDTTFSPEAVCTRAQIVTFLARFAGAKDTNTASAFSDVKNTDYFAAAVKWAKDNEVTKGTSDTTFSPELNCTRAQVVTFLWRWMVK